MKGRIQITIPEGNFVINPKISAIKKEVKVKVKRQRHISFNLSETELNSLPEYE